IEQIRVDGLIPGKHFLFVNPNGGSGPPPGIAWNGFIETENLLQLRYTNATGKPVALEPIDWAYCAMRRG
ncbi:MAG: hypothetical protein ACAH11_09490, partial [Sphingomonas sp.]